MATTSASLQLLRIGVLCCVACVSEMLAADSALACSPEAPPSREVCTSVTLNPLGDAMPMNGYSVLLRTHGGEVRDIPPPLPPAEELNVYHYAEQSWQPVGFSLQTNGMRLDEPVVGPFAVTWSGQGCSDAPRSPIDGAIEVGKFSLSPEAQLPTQLGTLAAGPMKTTVYEYEVGIDEGCDPIYGTRSEGEVLLTLTPDPAAIPWLSSTVLWSAVSGEPLNRLGSLPLPTKDGNVEVTLRFNCDATNATLPNGSYLVSLLGRVGELAEFTSTETEFTVACPAPPPEPIDTAMTGPEPPAAGPAQAPTQGLSAASEEQREDVSAIQDCGVGTMPRRSNAAWALLFALGAALLLRRHNRLDP